MAIVISDLLDDEAAILKGLQHLRFKGNDVVVFHIMDNAELTFPFERISEFEDLIANGNFHIVETDSLHSIAEQYFIIAKKI